MEWKKDNTDSEKLKLMEKEYIEAALRMMKRAGFNSVDKPTKPEEKENEAAASGEIHKIKEEADITETKDFADETVEEMPTEEMQAEDITAEVIDETISAEEAESEAMPDGETSTDETEATDEGGEEQTEQEEQAEKQKGDYGVYTAEEILKGEGLKDAERIIEEIKMQNETMKKLTEEQVKNSQLQRTCPKCGRTIDGCT